MDDVTNDVTDDLTNDVTDDLTNDVTDDLKNDVTDDLTNDVTDDLTNDVTDDLTNDVTVDLTYDVTDDLKNDVTDDLTNDVTDDLKNDVTDDLTNNVTDDFTDDLTSDLARALHISDLIVNCCQVNFARNIDYEVAFMTAFGYNLRKCIPVITGSCAELYIDPGNTRIGDVDLMIYFGEYIVVCEGSTVDSIDVSETFEVCQIVAPDCPNGYVRVRLYGKLKFNWETEKYEYCVSNNTGLHLHFFNQGFGADMLHGPATAVQVRSSYFTNYDTVSYIRLLGWPSVAQSWISRDRQYTWPSNAVVSEVQRSGCDLVPVSHRDHEHVKFQWRYSFSRAEVTLIRSWTPTQQLVYHMLRYIAKRTIILEWKDDDEVVCAYHIKTLMLWACEKKSPVWWESNCVIVLCLNRLDKLLKWVRKKMCPHYFIPEWNLFVYKIKHLRRLGTIETLRIHTDIRTLSEWFRSNYLSKMFVNTRRPTIRVRSINYSKLQHALDDIAASNRWDETFRSFLQKWVDEKYYLVFFSAQELATVLHYGSLHWTVTQFHWLIFSKNLAPELHILNLAVASLLLAWNISGMRESEFLNHELLDVLSEVVLNLSGYDTWNNITLYNIQFRQCSKWYFIKGVRLLSIYCNKHFAAYCLWVKTCKRYFKSALSIRDEYSGLIHDACHVYLSALYYVSRTNQEETTKHILEATNGTSSGSFSNPHFMNYSTLLFVDAVAHVCGFCFLFSHVSQNKIALSENRFSLSAIVYFLNLSVLRINKLKLEEQVGSWKLEVGRTISSSISTSNTKLDRMVFTSPFDICLWAVSVHAFHKWSSYILSNSSREHAVLLGRIAGRNAPENIRGNVHEIL